MHAYQFALIVSSGPMTHEQILDATDALGGAGCLDASIRGHVAGMEIVFERDADSLEEAIASAVENVERTGFAVSKVELQREAIAAS